MKFLVLSDLHLDYEALPVAVPDGADAVILAGDIAEGDAGITWARETFADLPVFYVPGNHEFYGGEIGKRVQTLHAAAADANVTLLDRAEVRLPGLRILGATLWTGFDLFAGEDEEELAWAKADARRYVPDFDGRIQCSVDGRTRALTPDDTQRRHHQARAWLVEQLTMPFDGKTLVVTHHAPSARSVPREYATHPATPAWASPLDTLIAKADCWVHGHVHQTCDYRIGGCRVLANPRGYGNEARAFDPSFLLEL